MESGFDLFRNVPMRGSSLERMKSPIRLDEDDRIDDTATYTAYYNGNRDPEDWEHLQMKIQSHLSVTEFRYIMKRVDVDSDEVPG